MDKMDSLKDYISGNLVFLEFLIELNEDKGYYNNLLIDDKTNLRAAKVGMISLLLQSIKEDIVELKDDEFLYKTPDRDINEALSKMIEKKDNEYYVKGVLFESAGEIISFFRNKMAHGCFIMDLEHNKVIFNKDGQELVININLLAGFVIGLAKAYFSRVNYSSFTKPLYMFNINPKERIASEYDIIRLLDNGKQLKFNLVRKDNGKIEDLVFDRIRRSVNIFKEFRDITELENCKEDINKYHPDYQFDYVIEPLPINAEEKKRFAKYFCRSFKETGLKNENIVKIIGDQFPNFMAELDTNFNAAKKSLTLLVLLQAIQKNNSLDADVISDYIDRVFNESLILDYGTLATAMISLFQAEFNYCKDNVFKDVNYEKFAFTGINTYLIDTKNGETESLKIELQGLYNHLNDVTDKLLELQIQKSNVLAKNLTKPLQIVNANISATEIIRNDIKNRINELGKTIELRESVETPLYLYNKAVIEGIRNSIAHGNYRVIMAPTLPESKIKFDDIYNDELTFSCDISFNDFYLSLAQNLQIINNIANYVDKNPELVLKKV